MAVNWSAVLAAKKCKDRFDQSGYEKWLSYDQHQKKVDGVAAFIRSKLSATDRVVNIGAGVGYLEERFLDLMEGGRWNAYDVAPQSCALSNGLVRQKEIINIADESVNGNFLIMMGCSLYFRSGHIYEACEVFEKILIIDLALEEYPLSIATLDPDHYSYSLRNFCQITKLVMKNIVLSHFAMVPHRMSIYITPEDLGCI